jgi:hypothetical protein
MMSAYTDLVSAVTGDLFGPGSPVPWWAWVAVLAMVLWGLLVPGARDN